MAQQNINLGANGSGVGGDTGRTAFEKVQANFNEIFSSMGSAANAKALNELTGYADRLPYFSGVGALSLAIITARARTLLAAGDQAGQLAAMGLGNAAVATVMSSLTDPTAGRLMINGAYGTGGPIVPHDGSAIGGFVWGSHAIGLPSDGPVAPGQGYYNVRTEGSGNTKYQLISDYFADRWWLRRTDGNGVYQPYRELLHSGNTAAIPVDVALAASVDNGRTLGSASLRWSTVYAGTGTINTSDAREKTEIRALTDGEITAAQQLAKEVGAYKFLAAVTEKGADAREHIGLTVQRAIEILQANGLEPFNYGFICYDSWPQVTVYHPATYEQVPVTDAEGNVTGYENGALIKEAWTEVTREAGDRYSFRTDELNLFIACGQAAYLAQLEARIAALEQTA